MCDLCLRLSHCNCGVWPQPKYYGMSYTFVPDDVSALPGAYADLEATGAIALLGPAPVAAAAHAGEIEFSVFV